MKYRFRLLIILLGGVIGPAPTAYADDFVAVAVEKNREIITIQLKDITPHKVFTLDSPDRLVVDVPAVPEPSELTLPRSYKGSLIRRLRTAWFNPTTTRLVFDLKQEVVVQKTLASKDARLTIDIAGTKGQPAPEQPAGSDKGFRIEKPVAEVPQAGKDMVDVTAGRKQADSRKESMEKPPVKESKKADSKKAVPSARDKPIIVIDPGHGGVDSGAMGSKDTKEKNIVLEYSKMLKTKLSKGGRYQVVLTRDRDDFIRLRKRVEIARKAGGSIFISLHADSANDMAARGLSVYTLSENASDAEAAALAARENKADVIAGIDLSDERKDVADILISLAERETKNRSATLADLIVTALDDKVRLLPNSHRFAGFAVLKAPDIPSVLIEIGFLSHPQEEKLIQSKSYQDKVIGGIASGVDAYFRMEKQMGVQ
jgi:N-acetylmuramoyl-L-alanine amidase